jgi:heme/copper-type cytochrome/quinol oxidase subunit 1
MISMLRPVFARRPIVGYTYVAVATVLTGVVGMGVWVHHMFASGLTPLSMSFFSAASMVIAIFSTVQVLAWIATLWHGRSVLTTSLLFALGAAVLAVGVLVSIWNFIVSGITGRRAGPNPWNADTLEWSLESPPPAYGSVHRGISFAIRSVL